jgi:hypothetical protein
VRRYVSLCGFPKHFPREKRNFNTRPTTREEEQDKADHTPVGGVGGGAHKGLAAGRAEGWRSDVVEAEEGKKKEAEGTEEVEERKG